jgi:hypothetical protein
MAGLLVATLAVRPQRHSRREEFLAIATLTNQGDEALLLNQALLGSSSLALEIVDAGGAPVLLPPPPVPGGPAPKVRLAPGQQRTAEYPNFLPQWTPAGAYRVRLRYLDRHAAPEPGAWTELLWSEWVEFTVTEG